MALAYKTYFCSLYLRIRVHNEVKQKTHTHKKKLHSALECSFLLNRVAQKESLFLVSGVLEVNSQCLMNVGRSTIRLGKT